MYKLKGQCDHSLEVKFKCERLHAYGQRDARLRSQTDSDSHVIFRLRYYFPFFDFCIIHKNFHLIYVFYLSQLCEIPSTYA